MAKYTKLEVLYQHPAKGMDHCSDCIHFEVLAPKHCEIVEGLIQPNGWCKKFSKEKIMAKKHHPFSHTVIEHHGDNSHTVHHIHEKHGFVHSTPAREGDVKHAVHNLDGVHDSMQDHLGTPNPGEAEANAGPAAAVAAPGMPGAPAAV